MNRQTTLAKNNEATREWVHIDATDKVLGRLASEIAMILMGKAKPTYTPHQDVGDFVIVTNCEKVKLTGKKLDQKFLETFSGYAGGRKTFSFRSVLDGNHPERILENAVRRMLPKNRLAATQLKKLKLYTGPSHPHQAQNPKTAEVCA